MGFHIAYVGRPCIPVRSKRYAAIPLGCSGLEQELVYGHDQVSIGRVFRAELHLQARNDVDPDPALAVNLERVSELQFAFIGH